MSNGSGHMSRLSELTKQNNAHRRERLKNYKKRIRNLSIVDIELEFKDATPEELKILKENFLKNKKKDKNRRLVYTSIISFILLFFLFNLFSNFYQFQNASLFKSHKLKALNNNSQEELTKKYNYLIEDGDMWITKKNYKNAVYNYKQAVKLYPDEFNANYRLSLAYSYNCRHNYLDCDKGEKLNNRLLKHFPNKLDVKKLEKIYNEFK